MSNWKDLLKEVAPTVAGAIGGPFTMTAINILADLLGVEQDEKKIGDVVASGDPQVLYKLRQAENDFNLALKEAEVDRDRLMHENTADARDLGKSKGLKAHYVLSAVFIGGYFCIFGAFVYALAIGVAVDQSWGMLFAALIGVMTASVKDIMNFWFGGSAGLKDSNDAMERLASYVAKTPQVKD